MNYFVFKIFSVCRKFTNKEKSIFKPLQKLEWLGMICNSPEFCLNITNRRINDTLSSLAEILKNLLGCSTPISQSDSYININVTCYG